MEISEFMNYGSRMAHSSRKKALLTLRDPKNKIDSESMIVWKVQKRNHISSSYSPYNILDNLGNTGYMA